MDEVVVMALIEDDGTVVLGNDSVMYVVPKSESSEWLDKYNGPGMNDRGYQWQPYRAYTMSGGK